MVCELSERSRRGWGLLITPNISGHKLDLFFFHRELVNVELKFRWNCIVSTSEGQGAAKKDKEGGRVGSTTASSVSSGNAVGRLGRKRVWCVCVCVYIGRGRRKSEQSVCVFRQYLGLSALGAPWSERGTRCRTPAEWRWYSRWPPRVIHDDRPLHGATALGVVSFHLNAFKNPWDNRFIDTIINILFIASLEINLFYPCHDISVWNLNLGIFRYKCNLILVVVRWSCHRVIFLKTGQAVYLVLVLVLFVLTLYSHDLLHNDVTVKHFPFSFFRLSALMVITFLLSNIIIIMISFIINR